MGPRLGALQWERRRKTLPTTIGAMDALGGRNSGKHVWRLDLSSRYSQSVGCSVDTILPRRGALASHLDDAEKRCTGPTTLVRGVGDPSILLNPGILVNAHCIAILSIV